MDFSAILARTPLFSRLSPEALATVCTNVRLREVKSGGTLFREGDAPDFMYVVATGRLRVTLASGVIAADVGRYELIGEIALLINEPRSASVHAVRDSLVLMLSREDLMSCVYAHPAALVEMTRVIIERLRQNQRARALEDARGMHAFAVIPAGGSVDPHIFAEAFCAALSRHQTVKLIDDVFVDSTLGAGTSLRPFEEGDSNERLMTWLSEIESQHRYLVYAGGGEADAWAKRCARQADRIIIVADAAAPPAMTPMLEHLRGGGRARVPVDLVLLCAEGAPPGDVLGWRECTRANAHYFARPGNVDDIDAIARQMTGRGIGLVLGGGGARGFAHIGLMRALHELKLPIDVLGGSSMGAFFAALMACGYDYTQAMEIARDTFVTHNYLNDYMFPTVALIRGRKFVRHLAEVFGERQIEQLRTPFFCVSTNLTRGAPVVHDRGLLSIWLACSMSVPGVAPPVAYKGELLVDGAVINSLPTDVMQSLRRGPIIASDVSTEGDLRAPGIEGPDPEGLLRWNAPSKRPTLFSIIFRTATLTSESGVAERAERADLYIRMPVSGVALFDWKKMDEVIERGYRHSLEKLTPVRDSLIK